MLSNILAAVDGGDIAALVLLDLLAAYDTVDYAILCQCLANVRPVCSRSQYVRRGHLKSAVTMLMCGVPRGLVLGPILFILYTADLVALIEKHGFRSHLYADNSQVYAWCRLLDLADFQLHLSNCIDNVALWMGPIACNLTPAKLTCSGVPLHVDNLSCHILVFHLGLVLTSSAHRAMSVILVFSSMLI